MDYKHVNDTRLVQIEAISSIWGTVHMCLSCADIRILSLFRSDLVFINWRQYDIAAASVFDTSTTAIVQAISRWFTEFSAFRPKTHILQNLWLWNVVYWTHLCGICRLKLFIMIVEETVQEHLKLTAVQLNDALFSRNKWTLKQTTQ